MKAGHRTEVRRGAIDYKGLRRFKAEAARRAVLEYLKTNFNVSGSARMFGSYRVELQYQYSGCSHRVSSGWLPVLVEKDVGA